MPIPLERLTLKAQFMLYVDYWVHNLGWELNQQSVDRLFNLFFQEDKDERLDELTKQAASTSKSKKPKK